MSRGQPAAVSWSAGKDSCLSLHRAVSQGLQVRFLLNMVNSDAGRSMSHGLDPRLIAAQADALGIPLVQQKTTWDTYEDNFKQTVADMRQQGVEVVVFGDIDIEGHRQWVERVCAELGVTPLLPLWGDDPAALLYEFVNAGFEALVVTVRVGMLGEEWLGRTLDRKLVAELLRLGADTGVHPCGEQGEYHTLVVDGPLFKKRLTIGDVSTIPREGYLFLDISTHGTECK